MAWMARWGAPVPRAQVCALVADPALESLELPEGADPNPTGDTVPRARQ